MLFAQSGALQYYIRGLFVLFAQSGALYDDLQGYSCIYCIEKELRICFRNRSAIGVKRWYLFQIKYIFISR